MIVALGRNIVAVGESNASGGLRFDSVGLQNTKVNPQAYKQLSCTTPGLGEYVFGAILF
jgi:fructose-bisphosphate aldolase class I